MPFIPYSDKDEVPIFVNIYLPTWEKTEFGSVNFA